MSNSCISENTYLESPEFLKTSLHTTAIFSVPISILGFYIILFKTPEQMKSAKLYIFNVHFTIVLLDYCIGFLVVPFWLIPAMAGFSLGLFRWFGVPESVLTIFLFIIVGLPAFSIMGLFESRFYIICEFPGKKYWKFWRHIWLSGQYMYYIFAMSSFYFFIPDQEMALKKLKENIPCLPDCSKTAPIFVLSDKKGFHMPLMITNLLIITIECSLFFLLLVHDISKKLKNNRISQKTVQMQKTFLLAIFLQISVPLITVIIPMAYIFAAISLNYYNQSLTNIAMTCVSTHGSISTIVMIMVHRPYRYAFFDMIGKTRKAGMAEAPMRTTKIHVNKN